MRRCQERTKDFLLDYYMEEINNLQRILQERIDQVNGERMRRGFKDFLLAMKSFQERVDQANREGRDPALRIFLLAMKVQGESEPSGWERKRPHFEDLAPGDENEGN
jgi:hypothetical protein